MRKKIGECLIQAGLITERDLQIALAEHQRTGERIGAVLVRLNFATEKQITKALAYQLGFPYASLADEPARSRRDRPDSQRSRAETCLCRRPAGEEPADGCDVGPAAFQPGPGSRVPDRLSHQAGRGHAPTSSRQSSPATRTRRWRSMRRSSDLGPEEANPRRGRPTPRRALVPRGDDDVFEQPPSSQAAAKAATPRRSSISSIWW